MERIGSHENQRPAERVIHTETGQVFEINEFRYETIEGALRIGVYRHYKSTPDDLRYYVVEKVVGAIESEERLVIYRPMDEVGADSPAYARPFEMFTDDVVVGKGKIPRFRFIAGR